MHSSICSDKSRHRLAHGSALFTRTSLAEFGKQSADTALDEQIGPVVRQYYLRLNERADFLAHRFLFDCHWGVLCKLNNLKLSLFKFASR
jgi:hypothetical protein